MKEFILWLIESGYLKEKTTWGKIHYEALVPKNPDSRRAMYLVRPKNEETGKVIDDVVLEQLLFSAPATVENISAYTEYPAEEIRKVIRKLYSLEIIEKVSVKGTALYRIVDIDQYHTLVLSKDQKASSDWKKNLFSKIKVNQEEPAKAEVKPEEPETTEEVGSIKDTEIKKKKQYKKREDGLSIPTMIMWHLLRYCKEHYDGSVDRALTQQGMVEALHIDQRYISTNLQRLKDKGYVKMNKMHVKGEKKQYNCYFLTLDGEREAKRQLELHKKE